MLDELKRLYDFGFCPLWLYPNSKRPIGNDWQKGDRPFWETLLKTHKEHYNVGVRLGTPSKFQDDTYLCVLDVDVKSSGPEHIKELELALNSFCPANEYAPRVLSGRGGGSCHIYFRTPKPQQSFKAIRSEHKVKVYMPSVDPSKVDRASLSESEIKEGYRMRLAWEVDVFGDGKQVVLPPSTHPDTLKPYTWHERLLNWDSIPKHKNFEPPKARAGLEKKKKIEFADVDLFSTTISEKHFDLIVRGEGFSEYPSRSEALFASLNALVNAGLSDAQIYSVLTDTTNFMSEKPMQAGQGDPERAAYWLRGQLAKIRGEKIQPFLDEAIVDDLDEILLSDAEAEEQEDELVTWESRLAVTKTGQYKNTAYNLYLILKHVDGSDEGRKALFAYDEFNQSNMYCFAPPWGDESDVGRELTDLDDIRVKTWLSKKWGIETSTQSISDVALQLGKENKFHPVRDYLKSLKWDGVARLDTMLEKYCGAVGDKEYLADVGRKVMTAAVARVFKPGVKFDYVLILEGNQGAGKSTFVRILADPWFTDALGDINSKDVVDNMRGKWLVELGELAQMRRSEVNDLKAFITRESDNVRKAYGRRSQTYPRHCIFIGTTNNDEYLKDETGGRRFWPVKTTRYKLADLAADKDQLWAEALLNYELGEALYLDNERVRLFAESEQESRLVVDEILEQVKSVIEAGNVPQDGFTFDDVWKHIGGGINLKPADYATQVRIKKAFRVLGYEQYRPRVGGRQIRTWKKKG